MARNYTPKSPENGGLTPEEVNSRKKSYFLRVLLENGGFKEAAIKQCRTSRRWFNEQLEVDEEFAATVQTIIDITNEQLVAEARRRALGYEVREPLSNKGMLTGEVKVTKQVSDNLLMFLIKGRMPEYRDGPGGKKGVDISDDELNERIRSWLAKKTSKGATIEAGEAVN
jgi:hypothetical protein